MLVLRLVGGVCRGRLLFTLFVLWLFVWFIMVCVCVWFDGDLRWGLLICCASCLRFMFDFVCLVFCLYLGGWLWLA